MTVTILFVSLAVLILLNIPIGVSLGLATIAAFLFGDVSIPLTVIPQRMFTALDSFPFMAIPFFMLAGAIMQSGGISARLINFAKNLVGSLPGGLGVISVFSSGFFGAISGSNAATVAAIGKIMIPSMTKDKYGKARAGAIVASAGTLGVVIPPSVPMITYGVISGVSISTLFIAGIIPGILMILVLCLTIFFIAKKNNLPTAGRITMRELGKSFWDAILSLLMPIIVLGGIYGGIFTPTEAAAIACVYALIITMFVYKEIKIKDLSSIIVEAGKSTSIVFFVIAASSAFSWLLTSQRIPDEIASSVLGLTDNPVVILLLINVILLLFGIFLETNAIILLITPMLLPIASHIGLDPLVLGILLVVNTSVGMITPPLALNIFIASDIAKATIEEVSKKIIPFFVALIVVVLAITYIPEIVLFLPNLLG
ncbi:TRAP transporter large permease [Bacillus sp. B15-48]|uniref:TRAP transporter large permease n=1 Tax=Bacillus sp. B15-48 TaxID=1548601 RepID=UPI00193FD6B3|nr:TRAP transporter large permease [Bacillus sp. B15-48]MBM4761419.1 TRAP transporter large permease subunit [Bacillus sp. B15-48]